MKLEDHCSEYFYPNNLKIPRSIRYVTSIFCIRLSLSCLNIALKITNFGANTQPCLTLVGTLIGAKNSPLIRALAYLHVVTKIEE